MLKDFFEFISDGKGNFLCFNAAERQQIEEGALRFKSGCKYLPDNDESIRDHNNLERKNTNTYDFNPLTGFFVIYELNVNDDSEEAYEWVRTLDFKTIVPGLAVKPIVNPFTNRRFERAVTQKEIDLLEEWINLWDGPIIKFIREIEEEEPDLWSYITSTLKRNLQDQMMPCARGLISTTAYATSFLNPDIWKRKGYKNGKNPFQCAIDLWEMGLAIEHDFTDWCLRGADGRILYTKKEKYN